MLAPQSTGGEHNTIGQGQRFTMSLVDSTDNYRMGAPGPLLPLPLQDSPIQANEAIITAWPASLRDEVMRAVRKHSIKYWSVGVYHRHLPMDEPSENDLTVFIIATRSDESGWAAFVDETYQSFCMLGYEHLHLEIADGRAMNGTKTFQILPEDRAVTWWPLVRPIVLAELCGIKWHCLQVVKRGYGFDGTQSTTTIMISAADMFDKEWDSVKGCIKEILRDQIRNEDEVNVEVIQGDDVHLAIPRRAQSFSMDSFTSACPLGSGFGPAQGCGTLGGYLNLVSSRGRITKLAFTSWSVMRENGKTEGYDTTGVAAENARTVSLRAFSPCLSEIENLIQWKQSEIDMRESRIISWRQDQETGEEVRQQTQDYHLECIQESRKKIKEMKDFNPLFGTLFAGGGLRKNTNDYPTDWALVTPVPERSCKNSLPDSMHSNPSTPPFVSAGQVFELDSSYLVASNPPQKIFTKRRSGVSWGIVNAIPADFVSEHQPGVIYSAIDICPPPEKIHDFCEGGDAGAAVLSQWGDWAGLLVGGSHPVCGQGGGMSHGFVVPMEDVVADIEEMTGCRVSLPPLEKELLRSSRRKVSLLTDPNHLLGS